MAAPFELWDMLCYVHSRPTLYQTAWKKKSDYVIFFFFKSWSCLSSQSTSQHKWKCGIERLSYSTKLCLKVFTFAVSSEKNVVLSLYHIALNKLFFSFFTKAINPGDVSLAQIICQSLSLGVWFLFFILLFLTSIVTDDFLAPLIFCSPFFGQSCPCVTSSFCFRSFASTVIVCLTLIGFTWSSLNPLNSSTCAKTSGSEDR